MKQKFWFVCDRMTKCDSGRTLNPLMHVFLFITFVFSFAFVFLSSDASVSNSILYKQTGQVDDTAIGMWGVVGLFAILSHVFGLLVRGKFGIRFMQFSMYAGFYMWLWAAVVYLQDSYYFQFAAAAVPNLLFWSWYAWQWRKRYAHPGDPEVEAFI